MIKVIGSLTVVAAATLVLAYEAYNQFMPIPVATAVVAEKPDKTVGGQAGFLLPESLTDKQAKLLEMARTIAKKEGVSPEVAQGVLLQESHAGGIASYKVANPGPDAYFGPMQIKLSATKDVLKKSPELYKKFDFHTKTDDEIKANLILNEAFNLEVGIKYIRMLKEGYGFTGRKLMNAYNRGPGGVEKVDDDFHYAKGAEQKLVEWRTAKK